RPLKILVAFAHTRQNEQGSASRRACRRHILPPVADEKRALGIESKFFRSGKDHSRIWLSPRMRLPVMGGAVIKLLDLETMRPDRRLNRFCHVIQNLRRG